MLEAAVVSPPPLAPRARSPTRPVSAPASPGKAPLSPGGNEAVSVAGSITMILGEDSATFGWRAGATANEFGQQLRSAVCHFTGLKSLQGAELQLEPPTPAAPWRKITPRDLFEGRVAQEGIVPRVRVLLPDGEPTSPKVKSPGTKGPRSPGVQFAEEARPRSPDGRARSGSPDDRAPRSKSPDDRARSKSPDDRAPPVSRGAGLQPVPKRNAGKGQFQKGGGSQMQFVRMLSQSKGSSAPPGTRLTAAEVKRHNTAGDCWTIFQGRVYDLTLYMDYHPGGKKELMKGAGRDCTSVFNKVHPWVSFDGLMGKCCLGPLVADAPGERGPGRPASLAVPGKAPVAAPGTGAFGTAALEASVRSI